MIGLVKKSKANSNIYSYSCCSERSPIPWNFAASTRYTSGITRLLYSSTTLTLAAAGNDEEEDEDDEDGVGTLADLRKESACVADKSAGACGNSEPPKSRICAAVSSSKLATFIVNCLPW